MILSEIIEHKRKSIEASKKLVSFEYLKHRLSTETWRRRDFKAAVSRSHNINIIAEIKKASPTRGVIREDFDPVIIAEEYQINGASAISVLTEEKYFQGRLDYIGKVKKACSLPVLRKDFILDEYQVYESALAGADAILLIAAILPKQDLAKFHLLARSLGMAVLCEIHTEEDLEKAVSSKANIIGINNRDLSTFKLHKETTQNLAPLVPKGKIIVSESGIKSQEDVFFLKSLGINAVLAGEALMDAEDIGAKLKEFLGKQSA